MTSPYMTWKVRDVMNDAKARAWFYPYFREEFSILSYLASSREDWQVILRAFGGVKKLHECELTVSELYSRVASWSPGEEEE